MPTTLTRFVLFLSSYAPLMLIFAIRDPLRFRSSQHVFFGLAIASLALLWLYLRAGQRLAPHSITVQTAQVRDAEAMSYIVTYFLPFLGISGNNWSDAVSLRLEESSATPTGSFRFRPPLLLTGAFRRTWRRLSCLWFFGAGFSFDFPQQVVECFC